MSHLHCAGCDHWQTAVTMQRPGEGIRRRCLELVSGAGRAVVVETHDGVATPPWAYTLPDFGCVLHKPVGLATSEAPR